MDMRDSAIVLFTKRVLPFYPKSLTIYSTKNIERIQNYGNYPEHYG